MLIHSRFVVVDDKEHHISGIKQSLDTLRLDCHSKLYSDEAVAEWVKLPGTRILFLDQNLTTGATFGTTNNVAFAAIADVIQKVICPNSGPYGLILWAEEPELESLRINMFERFTGDDAKLLPVFFAALQKGDYIDTNSGNILNPDKLKQDIISRISESPQLKAILSWEADVNAAMDAVLRSVVDLVDEQDRASENFSNELGKVLYRLSQAGAGISRATDNPREAINRVLVPILADRIIGHDPDSGAIVEWNSALVEPTMAASVMAQGSINSSIHLSLPNSNGENPLSPTELGAVIQFPFEDVEQCLINNFGITQLELQQSLKFNEAEWQDCRLKLVQIGATCDNAQPKIGPLLYLLGVQWPFAAADGSRTDQKPSLKSNRKPGSGQEWNSPILKIPEFENSGVITVFKNMSISVPRNRTEGWTTSYRFRDELISTLTQEYARHISRPGIVIFPEKN